MINITGHTGLTGLLGSPVAHSVSPLMHNEAFRYLGLDYVYLCFDVTEETLPQAVEGLKACGIKGFNLTMPNKNKIVELLDELSPTAQLIGAVNTVRNDNGKLKGFNTDGYGFTQSARDAGCDVKGRTITVMGVGGAGMAICGQSALEGAKKIHVFARPTSRYWERAAAMAEKMSHMTECEMILHEMDDHTALKDALEESNLLINATSVGMVPDVTGTVIPDKALFHPELTVADVVYEPRETRLLREAREAGCPTFNGMYMLLHQGVKASTSGPDWTCRLNSSGRNILNKKYPAILTASASQRGLNIAGSKIKAARLSHGSPFIYPSIICFVYFFSS